MAAARAVVAASVMAGLAVASAAPSLAGTADQAGPVVTFTSVRYVVGTTLSSSSTTDAGLPMTFSWSQHDPDGICQRSAELDDNALGGDLPDIRPHATSYTADVGQTATSNQTVLNIGTSDCAGNPSSTYAGRKDQLVQEDAFARSKGWQVSSCGCSSGGSALRSTKRGAKLSYTFYGTAAALIGSVRAGGGAADVRVGSGAATRVDTSGARTDRVVLFQASWATAGNHTLTVTADGSQALVVDALAVSTP